MRHNKYFHILFLFIFFLLSGCSAFNGGKIDLGYKVYVSNLSSQNITVVPPKHSTDTTIIDLNDPPLFMAKVPHNDKVFVLMDKNKIASIDSEEDTLNKIFYLEIGSDPPQDNHKMILSSDGKKAYISTSYEKCSIALMDTEKEEFTNGIDLNSSTVEDLILTNQDKTLYGIDKTQSKIYEIDTSKLTLVKTLNIPEQFNHALYIPNEGFILDSVDNSYIQVFDPINEIYTKKIENVSNKIEMLSLDPSENKIYALTEEEIVTIDLQKETVVDRTCLEYTNPSFFCFLPNGKYLLITFPSVNILSILDGENFNSEDAIDTEENPQQIIIIN